MSTFHYHTLLIVTLLLVTLLTLVSQVIPCHEFQVERGGLCCRPFFNCDPGNQIVECKANGSLETCEPCNSDKVQPDRISSFIENRKCVPKQDVCTAADMTYSVEPRKNCYPVYCKCDTTKCFYEKRCTCLKQDPCGVNETLNATSGECEPCPTYAYKKESGCGPCTIDEKAWMLEKGAAALTQSQTPPVINTEVQGTSRSPKASQRTTVPPSGHQSEQCQDNQNDYMIGIIILAITIVVVIIISGMVCYLLNKRSNIRKQKLRRLSSTSFRRESAHTPLRQQENEATV